MNSKTKIAIVGAAGYSGQELEVCLKRHRYFEIVERVGRDFDLKILKGRVELVFLCTPAETSLEMAPKLNELGIHVVDLSGAFRLKRNSYKEWYGFDHVESDVLKKAEYALYPFRRVPSVKKQSSARLISNPGCYSTATALGLIPLVQSGWFKNDSFFVDAKSGTSGAGRKAQTDLLFSELYGEFKPYKVGKHQHWPEVVEAIEDFAAQKISPVFITELLPVFRGISLCIFADWKGAAKSVQDIISLYETTYKDDSQIKVGVEPDLMSLKKVSHTNFVHISPQIAYGRPVVFVLIDNLQRGAAGQALMNANQLFEYDIFEGLT